jgi:hypothetical protein
VTATQDTNTPGQPVSRDVSSPDARRPGSNVESPKVAAQQGGWAGPQTAGRTPVVDHDDAGWDEDGPLTREAWIALQVARAPEIPAAAWRRTVRLLRGARREMVD